VSTADLSFVAQSLDNIGDNPMVVAVAVAPGSNTMVERRRVLMRRISRVRARGVPVVLESERLIGHRLASEFTLEIDLLDGDHAGRVSPILVHGWLPVGDIAAWSEGLIDACRRFVIGLQRPFDDELGELLSQAVRPFIESRLSHDMCWGRRLWRGTRHAIAALIAEPRSDSRLSSSDGESLRPQSYDRSEDPE
jgi:hypothetical protein